MTEAPPGVAARWLAAGEWRAHPGRIVTAALAVAIGVALGFAVHLINASALNEFGRAVRAVNGEADLRVRSASPDGFAEGLYPRLARTDGVVAASPVVEMRATAAGDPASLTLIGLDVLRAARVTPSLVGGAGLAAFGADAVLLSPALMTQDGVKAGETVLLTANGMSHGFRVAGELEGLAADARIAVVDIADAQWRFGRIGRLDRIDLAIAEGADLRVVRGRISDALPANAQLADAQSDARASDSLSRAYRVNLNMLALMALLTGGFLVYSAQSLSVARRRTQFALLRVLGTSRRSLLIQILVEGAVVGGVGALAGLALGLGIARLALGVFGGDLGGGYFSGETPELIFAPVAATVFFLLGLAAALAGSLAPARTAANAPPAVALKNLGDAVDPRLAPRPWIAIAAFGLAGLTALAPPIGGLPIAGYAAMALLLVGGVAAMPWLARRLLQPLQGRGFGAPPIELALRRLWGAPSQASVALAAVVASTSLMIAMAVMVASFRGSVDEWLDQILPDDLYMRVEPAAGGLDPALQARLLAAPGVEAIRFQTTVPVRMNADRPTVALLARPLTRGGPGEDLPMIAEAAAPTEAIRVWISEPMARLYGLKAGETFDLPIGPAAVQPVFVAGVWRDYARQHGAVVIAAPDYDRLTGDAARGEASIELVAGADAAEVQRNLEAALPAELEGRVTFARPRELRDLALRIFDRSFAVTYLLEAVAILVGLAGVAATISAQTLARTKEFGMLRHLGVTRRQITAMLATEGALLGIVGGLAGVGLGLVMSQVLIHVINPQSFNWTMDTRAPWGLMAGVSLALVVASAGAALAAGRRALSADAVRAVREDW
jgi:putative ABC transport system permease protein